MPIYTLTLLNADERVHSKDELHARDDSQIAQIASRIRHPHPIDIHDATRHVLRVPPWKQADHS
jgi:hypothetical protein